MSSSKQTMNFVVWCHLKEVQCMGTSMYTADLGFLAFIIYLGIEVRSKNKSEKWNGWNLCKQTHNRENCFCEVRK